MHRFSYELTSLAESLVFLSAAGTYAFLWIRLTSATVRQRMAFAVLGIVWLGVGALAALTALDWRAGEDALGDALLLLFFVVLGVPLIVLGISSMVGSVLPNGEVRRWVMIPLLVLTPVSGLLILVGMILTHSTE